MTTRKPVPKPMRAWVRVSGPAGMKPWLAPNCCCEDRGIACLFEKSGLKLHQQHNEYAAKATIVPDGTPSQDAEVRKLRRENARLRRALTFYANENAYLYQGDIHLMGSVIAERGNIARVTLAGGDPMGNAERSLRRAKAKDAALRGRRGK